MAARAGVSIMSVSRAMRGVEGVSTETRSRILDAAEALRYSPSSVAGALATANSSLVGVSVPTLQDSVFSDIFSAMRSTFERSGMQTVFDTTEYDNAREEAFVERMIAWRAAGIVLSGGHHTPRTRRMLRRANVSVLEIWSWSADPIELCVGLDHEASGYAMGRRLLEMGYQSPAYIGPQPGYDRRAEQRCRGFTRAFVEQGLSLVRQAWVTGKHSFAGGRIGMANLLDKPGPAFDLVYFLNDHMAFGGLEECRARGIKVPDQLGLAAFNGLQINDVLRQPITTSYSPRADIGEQGARMLIGAIKGVAQERSVKLEPTIMMGETTKARW
ncbi:MAG: LacI family DNA-binding transcriptional regulator [Pseudomonadota bacterium]